MTDNNNGAAPAISIRGGSLAFGARTLWKDLTLDIGAGEYFAVLGPNGSGKSTFLKVVLGLTGLNAGEISVLGKPARLGNAGVGYVPQQKSIPTSTPMRARDLVGLGVAGTAGASACTAANTAPRLTSSSKPSAQPNTRTCRWACSPAVSSSVCVSPRRSRTTRRFCWLTRRYSPWTSTTSTRWLS